MLQSQTNHMSFKFITLGVTHSLTELKPSWRHDHVTPLLNELQWLHGPPSYSTNVLSSLKLMSTKCISKQNKTKQNKKKRPHIHQPVRSGLCSNTDTILLDPPCSPYHGPATRVHLQYMYSRRQCRPAPYSSLIME